MQEDDAILCDKISDKKGLHKAFKASPQRKCSVTGNIYNKAEMIRFVIGPDESLVPDLAAKLPGRGVYVACTAEAVKAIAQKGKLAKAVQRSLKRSLAKGAIEQDLVGQVAGLLKKRLLDRLGMQLRSGMLIVGFDKLVEITKAVQGNGFFKKDKYFGAAFSASDAAEDSLRKINNALRQSQLDEDVAQITSLPLTRDEISQALGKENAVHMLAFQDKGLEHLQQDIQRFTAFCDL